jgi:RNA polymerase sigma-70 factor (ECF subfamily)
MIMPAYEPSDDHLIVAFLEGDDDAFARLVGRHKRRVIALAARFARDADDLDDISQEVFIKVYQTVKSYRRDAPFEHWLSRLTVRACYDHLRRHRHDRKHCPLDQVAHELGDPSCAAREEAEQARQILRAAMMHLSPKEQLVLTLLSLEEKSLREVAELTGWSEGNVKVRAFRARQELKRILETTR